MLNSTICLTRLSPDRLVKRFVMVVYENYFSHAVGRKF